ncbi:BON domain-containing protein [Selenomonas bovis]|uniref:BON domain-containing protein n=1 Tax=Selenomonas bovis TaxID=416586 RepID=A0A848B5K8_9FIRM|nr:pilus assembly protein N-terminal domain-containing protein [Selenomonas bovis]NMD99203.1 BON domain-containing protein [Selenomonas bovis]
MFSIHHKYCVALGAAVIAAVSQAPAYAYVQPIYLEMNQSYYLPQGSAIKRVAVTNPEIADVAVVDKRALNVIGKKTGSTSLTVWTADGMRQDFSICVSGVDSGLAEIIRKAIGLPKVKVEVVGGKVLLTGTVQNQKEKTLAYRVASLYAGGNGGEDKALERTLLGEDAQVNDSIDGDDKVINLLEMINPDQINIEAEVIEINANDAKQIGIEYGADSSVGTPGTWYANKSGRDITEYYRDWTGKITDSKTYHSNLMRDAGSHWYTRNWLYTHFSDINAKIHTLVTNGHARIISRPNITTMSGKTAGILVGGEIPYPKKNDNSTSIEYKPYGIKLNLMSPTVDASGNVTSRVFAEVSRLDWGNAVVVDGFKMPATAKSSAETMVNIPSGMTMVIGGLLNSDDTKNISKIPLLGDIPFLGELFKYHNDTKQKSEIMILITPRVVNETTPVAMSQKMKDAYAEDKQEQAKMTKVDVNDPALKTSKQEKKEKKAKEAAAQKEKERQAEAQAAKDRANAEKAAKASKAKKPAAAKEKKDTLLNKYLDHSVLKDGKAK